MLTASKNLPYIMDKARMPIRSPRMFQMFNVHLCRGLSVIYNLVFKLFGNDCFRLRRLIFMSLSKKSVLSRACQNEKSIYLSRSAQINGQLYKTGV